MEDEEYCSYLNYKGVIDSIVKYKNNKDYAFSNLDFYIYYKENEELIKDIISFIFKSISEIESSLGGKKENKDFVKIIENYNMYVSYRSIDHIDFYKIPNEAFASEKLLSSHIAIILAIKKINFTKAKLLLNLDKFDSLTDREKQKILLSSVIDIAENISFYIVKKEKEDKEINSLESLSYHRDIKATIH